MLFDGVNQLNAQFNLKIELSEPNNPVSFYCIHLFIESQCLICLEFICYFC